ncbi:hypothetical protein [Streptomyces sp. SID13031]|uniref:hypothetical protein n=1 Tax=Streptomyces sp. SID13031 TaxID=2706046 RepID=UPI0013C77DB3|nr:hypothetical protein [Streptomyces sp. SID13031]NEA34986.1 hypothetical protein [Streptomyces sp. SID13031]
MKASVLRAVVGVAAVLSGLLVASPAQAADGPVSARVYYPSPSSGSGGLASANLDFVNRTTVVYRSLKVRDICPGDNRPVFAQMTVLDTNGRLWYVGPAKRDNNGCGPDGTNFGNVTLTSGFVVARAALAVCVYNTSATLRCKTSVSRDNPYV